MEWKNLTVLDLDVLVATSQIGSVRGVARKLQLNPSHVSKILRRLEQRLDKSLFRTSSKGITLTRDANDIVGFAERILQDSNRLIGIASPEERPRQEVISIGALSFLNKALVSQALQSIDPHQKPLKGTGDSGKRCPHSPYHFFFWGPFVSRWILSSKIFSGE